MLNHLVARILAPRSQNGPNRQRQRRMCRLGVEILEGRLLLSSGMVLRWNEILWQAEWTAGVAAPVNSRIMAIVQAAVYDAVNSIDGSYTPYLAAIPAPSGASEDAAAATAAHDTLVALFPAQASVLDLQLTASLQGIKDGDSKTAGIMVGQIAAQNILAARANDGSDKMVDYTPGTNPGDFQPTGPTVAAPQWPQVTPFCLQSGSQFRPPPPPALTSPEYTAAFNQVKDLGAVNSTARTADQTEAALFWAGVVPTTNFLPLTNQMARNVAEARGNSLVENARMFALLDLALADGAIACWDAKYTYNFWRPITAIRAADTDGNPDTEADPNWTPLLPTPNHPSYTSAHSAAMGVSAEVLTRYFGSDDISYSLSWFSLPGVTRSYTSFSQAAQECAMARVWLGIHYSFDGTAGIDLGRSVGAYVFQNFLLPRGGGAAPRSAGRGHVTSPDLAAGVGVRGETAHTAPSSPLTESTTVSGSSSPTPLMMEARVYSMPADAASNSSVYHASAPGVLHTTGVDELWNGLSGLE